MSVDDGYLERRLSEQIRWKGNRRKCSGWVPGHSTFLASSTWEEKRLYGAVVEHQIWWRGWNLNGKREMQKARFYQRWLPDCGMVLAAPTPAEQIIYGKRLPPDPVVMSNDWGREVNRAIRRAMVKDAKSG